MYTIILKVFLLQSHANNKTINDYTLNNLILKQNRNFAQLLASVEGKGRGGKIKTETQNPSIKG